MLRARFRMGLPDDVWANEVSTSFPEASLRLLTGVPKGDRALELGEVRAEDPRAVSSRIREHPAISEYERLYAGDQRTIAQYEAREKSFYEFLWASSLPPEFPVVVRNGHLEFDVTATQDQLQEFRSALDDLDRRYELLSLVHSDEPDSLLTDRQWEALRVAHHRGYFDVPRSCTLADVADALDVDKSSASETVRRGAGRLIGQFILSRDGPDRQFSIPEDGR